MRPTSLAMAVVVASVAQAALAQDAADLAQQLSNPVADLVSVPLQLNYDENIGADDSGSRWVLNVQPVIPFSLSSDWNLISRTILPVVSIDGIPSGAGSDLGFGDTVQSFFFSPKTPTAGGWIWGAGPVLLLPTSSDARFGAGEWGLGVTGVALKQDGPWTYGALANHIVDAGGDTDINSTFLQPFLTYTTPTAWTFSLNTEATYDWDADQWSVPVNAVVSKLVTIGNQPVSIGAGARYWAESAPAGPEGWGARVVVTFLFPR